MLPRTPAGGQLHQSHSDSKIRGPTSVKLPEITRPNSASCASEYMDLQRPKSRGTAAADRLMMLMSKDGGSRPCTSGNCSLQVTLPLKDTFARRTAPWSESS